MGDWAPSKRQPLASLHDRFLTGLGDSVATRPATEALTGKPLDIACQSPLPDQVRLYIFNCTDHPSERKAGDYRIQLRLPGQPKKQHGQLDLEPGWLILLTGYVVEFDIFVFWDPHAHADFPYSKGVQVGATTVHEAAIRGQCQQRRGVRANSYPETVLAVRADRLIEGVKMRQELTQASLLATGSGDPR